MEQLSAFLNALEGKVIVITKPVLLDWGDARTLAGLENGGVLDSKDTGVYRIDGGLLSQILAEGVGLEEALKEKGDASTAPRRLVPGRLSHPLRLERRHGG